MSSLAQPKVIRVVSESVYGDRILGQGSCNVGQKRRVAVPGDRALAHLA
jgi:hypothetical protein